MTFLTQRIAIPGTYKGQSGTTGKGRPKGGRGSAGDCCGELEGGTPPLLGATQTQPLCLEEKLEIRFCCEILQLSHQFATSVLDIPMPVPLCQFNPLTKLCVPIICNPNTAAHVLHFLLWSPSTNSLSRSLELTLFCEFGFYLDVV